MDFVESYDEVVRTCDQHTIIKENDTILIPIGDGTKLPAKYTPSIDSNLVSCKVISDCSDVEYSNTKRFVIRDTSSGRAV